MAKPRVCTQADLARMFGRMIETLEANLAARKAAEAQKTEQAAETVGERPARAHYGFAGEASV
ncbi:hypothetical protein [Paraburkholderia sp. GAS42]|uniref:hypothetical protein n=1 Tax=Paraburkholderia sp. GAS42 TaxID=3035135 RepID=UPI003D1A9F23